MRTLILSALLLAGAPGAAFAQAQEAPSTPQPEVQRVLYVCEATAQESRAFRIEHGEVVYMSAEDVIAAQSRGEAWETPRCITAEELRRLESMRTVRVSS
jgi:hypothetical protein